MDPDLPPVPGIRGARNNTAVRPEVEGSQEGSDFVLHLIIFRDDLIVERDKG